MPLDPIVGQALVQGGAGFATAGLNALTTGHQNKKSRQWSEKMYNQQWQDNLTAWHRQNTYNSPQEQMKRLQEAGLNPNLVYGSGSAQQPAGAIQSPNVQRPQFNTPDLSGISQGAATGISAIYDLQGKKLTNDNLKAQNDVIIQEGLLKRVMIKMGMTDEERKRFDLEFEKELRPISFQFREGALKLQSYDTALRLEQANHEQLKGNLTDQQAKHEEEKRGVTYQVKERERYDNQLRAWGLQPTDNVNYRIIGRALAERGGIIDLKMVAQLLAQGMIEWID